MAVAWVWWRFVGTGPIEMLMGLVTGRYRWPWRRRVSPRATQSELSRRFSRKTRTSASSSSETLWVRPW